MKELICENLLHPRPPGSHRVRPVRLPRLGPAGRVGELSSSRSGAGILLPLRAGQARQTELLDQIQILLNQGQRVPGGLGRFLW